MAIMSKIVRNKEQINATVTPYLKKRCIEIAEGPDFTSISDIVSQALSEFITKYDERKVKEINKYEENAQMLIYALMQTKSGQDWLEIMSKSNKMEESLNSKNSKLLELIKTICSSNEENSSTER
jgi:two-component system, sensor histidine kinase PdtaS